MAEKPGHNLTNPDLWIRLVYMLIFGLLLWVARLVIGVVTLLQFLMVLFTGGDNANLRNLGQGVARWSLHAHLFLTFNTESKPFPFDDWPEIEEADSTWQRGTDKNAERADLSVSDDEDVPSFTGGSPREGETDRR